MKNEEWKMENGKWKMENGKWKMENGINKINILTENSLQKEFFKCCASAKWVSHLIDARPFHSEKDLLLKAEKIWFEKCGRADWLEAFKAHPKIGDIDSLAKKYANTKNWSDNEQAGIRTASTKILQALADGNEKYEKKYGYIFIICATGKNAEEMLGILNGRINNDPEKEILIAMQEQYKITELRLNKWLMNNG